MQNKEDVFGTITTIDTSIATHNVGDEIIMKAVDESIYSTFPNSRICRVPSHEQIGRTSLSLIRNSDHAILGGSNILSSYMNKYRQWKIGILDSLLIKGKVVLLGVGWRNYQGEPNLYTRYLLKNLLDPAKLHSVRDSYTEQRLKKMGFPNVINTSCATMWKLDPELCRQIPTKPKSKVVFTLTDYDKDFERDSVMIDAIRSSFKEVWFWVQGKRDMEYFQSFGKLTENVKVIPPNLQSYDDFLSANECDYVGTRLHGGIRAMQKKRRTIIIGIDNRAREKKTDFNLPVLDRKEIDKLRGMVNESFETILNIPFERIDEWRSQFKK